MDVQGHMETVGFNKKTLARATGLSEATVKAAMDGRPLTQQSVDWLLAALSLAYGRPVTRDEIEGLRVADAPETQ